MIDKDRINKRVKSLFDKAEQKLKEIFITESLGESLECQNDTENYTYKIFKTLVKNKL